MSGKPARPVSPAFCHRCRCEELAAHCPSRTCNWKRCTSCRAVSGFVRGAPVFYGGTGI